MNYLEIPLAVLSFCFYKGMKFIIGNLYTLYLWKNQDKASTWRVLSAENLQSPLSLPVLMTKGPRWNTHAIIGTLGPFAVKDRIEVNLKSLQQSARSWILVIYRFPSYETITNLDSNQIDSIEEWITIALERGQYTLALRYYDRAPPIIFPVVKIDSQVFANSLTAAENTNAFYQHLIERKNGFYLALHYYIFTILKYRQYLPTAFVRQEFLPVGAPDTEFVYDRLETGRSLHLQIDRAILENFYVFLTLYDRSSLPIHSAQVTDIEYSSEKMENNGFFLLRLRPRSRNDTARINSQKINSDGVDSLILSLST